MKYIVRVDLRTEVEVSGASQEQVEENVKTRLLAALQQAGRAQPVNNYRWVRARSVPGQESEDA